MPTILDLRTYSADGILTDGTSIHIRAIRSDDRARLLDHFGRLSPESSYFRFMGLKRSLTDADLDTFTELDYVRNFGLVATLQDQTDERIIGVGRYMAVGGDGAKRAEVAFAIDDAHQGQGIGTLLLEHLARIARANGIDELEATVLTSNSRMLEVFAKSGFALRRSMEAGVVTVHFRTEDTEELLNRSLYRERLAASQSVGRLLKPKSVAVIGASQDRRKIGGAIVANLKAGGFTGEIYPVNPGSSEVQGISAFASVSAVKTPIDLAVICVPAQAVESVVHDCAAAGVHGLVVITSGFSEVSGDGRSLQERVLQFVRGCGMRMVGPNCMGVINTDPAVRLNATFAPIPPIPGNIGMLSQSGALGIAILDQARTRDIGISSFVSVGNKADVSSNDLLAYWADDPYTQVILLYLESFGNPDKFARLAKSVSQRKPIVAVKSGRSNAGRRAALSHSASLASLDVAIDALFEQCGVIRTDTLEQFLDVAEVLSTQPLPPGPNVGVVTNAGGPAILLADACEGGGLVLPELSATTQTALKGFLSPKAAFSNPVDMTAAATPQDYERTMTLVAGDPNIDSLVVIYIPPLVSDPVEIASGIARGAAAVPAGKPLVNVFLSSERPPRQFNEGPRGRLPQYSFPENAAMALGAAYRYARWRNRPTGTRFTFSDQARLGIRQTVNRLLAGLNQSAWIEPKDLKPLLLQAGIDLALAEQTTIDMAGAVARQMGFPLVAKVVSRDVVHKTDVGGVIMGLRSVEEVNAAVRTLVERMSRVGKRLDGVLLQRQIDEGIEALVGATDDPTFGKIVVCGLGGVAVEIIKDVSFRVPPITDIDAADMIGALRSSRLLDGFRGSPPADREALKTLICRVSALVEMVPEIVELDLNPVRLLPPGRGLIALDARMRLDPAARFRQVLL